MILFLSLKGGICAFPPAKIFIQADLDPPFLPSEKRLKIDPTSAQSLPPFPLSTNRTPFLNFLTPHACKTNGKASRDGPLSALLTHNPPETRLPSKCVSPLANADTSLTQEIRSATFFIGQPGLVKSPPEQAKSFLSKKLSLLALPASLHPWLERTSLFPPLPQEAEL